MSLRRRVLEYFVVADPARPPDDDATVARRARPGGLADTGWQPGPDATVARRASAGALTVFAGPGEAPERACAVPRPRTPPGIAVLCAPADAAALGAAFALAVAGHQRAPVVAVCAWTGSEPGRPSWRAPAMPAARRLSRTLAARGHDASATGRLAVVRLRSQCDDAAAEAWRVIAAAGQAPSVIALGGPRSPAFDELLAAQDLVVVATRSGADAALARLAVAGLAAAAVRACACEVAPSLPARTLATAGLALLPSARRALARKVEAL